mmetsp:Transcript_26313/g.86365  ORF Transcript_26313/g.86365 Transcript_26313/m.86365 type:complete len:188 (-) Transcript_26313:2883-3446(-)
MSPPPSSPGSGSADPYRSSKIFLAGGLGGAVSRTVTAPIDRLRMLLSVHEGTKRLTMLDGLRKMQAEGTIKAFFSRQRSQRDQDCTRDGVQVCDVRRVQAARGWRAADAVVPSFVWRRHFGRRCAVQRLSARDDPYAAVCVAARNVRWHQRLCAPDYGQGGGRHVLPRHRAVSVGNPPVRWSGHGSV